MEIDCAISTSEFLLDSFAQFKDVAFEVFPLEFYSIVFLLWHFCYSDSVKSSNSEFPNLWSDFIAFFLLNLFCFPFSICKLLGVHTCELFLSCCSSQTIQAECIFMSWRYSPSTVCAYSGFRHRIKIKKEIKVWIIHWFYLNKRSNMMIHNKHPIHSLSLFFDIVIVCKKNK